MAAMNTVKMTVVEHVAEVHERLYALAQVARRAESYHRAKNVNRLASTLAEAEQLAEVPFGPEVEAALNRLRNVDGVWDVPGSGGVSASSHTQLVIAVYRTVRNALVGRCLPHLGDVELVTSELIPGSDYPLLDTPVGVTEEQIAKLLVADSGVAVILAGWRVACERIVPKLECDVISVVFEEAMSDVGVARQPSEGYEMLADAVDTGWCPEPSERKFAGDTDEESPPATRGAGRRER